MSGVTVIPPAGINIELSRTMENPLPYIKERRKASAKIIRLSTIIEDPDEHGVAKVRSLSGREYMIQISDYRAALAGSETGITIYTTLTYCQRKQANRAFVDENIARIYRTHNGENHPFIASEFNILPQEMMIINRSGKVRGIQKNSSHGTLWILSESGLRTAEELTGILRRDLK